MSRFDVEKFEPPPDPDLVCCICQCVLDGPVESPCRHVFCKICIETWLRNNRNCPNCRSRLRNDDLKPVLPLVQNMLNRLLMFCDFRSNGCTQKVMLETYEKHIKECEFEMLKCKYEKCGQSLLRKDLKKHEEDLCEFREKRCTDRCGLSIPIRDFDSHDCIEELRKFIAVRDSLFQQMKRKIQELSTLTDTLTGQIESLRRELRRRGYYHSDWSYRSDDSGDTYYSGDDYYSDHSYEYSDHGEHNSRTNFSRRYSRPRSPSYWRRSSSRERASSARRTYSPSYGDYAQRSLSRESRASSRTSARSRSRSSSSSRSRSRDSVRSQNSAQSRSSGHMSPDSDSSTSNHSRKSEESRYSTSSNSSTRRSWMEGRSTMHTFRGNYTFYSPQNSRAEESSHSLNDDSDRDSTAEESDSSASTIVQRSRNIANSPSSSDSESSRTYDYKRQHSASNSYNVPEVNSEESRQSRSDRREGSPQSHVTSLDYSDAEDDSHHGNTMQSPKSNTTDLDYMESPRSEDLDPAQILSNQYEPRRFRYRSDSSVSGESEYHSADERQRIENEGQHTDNDDNSIKSGNVLCNDQDDNICYSSDVSEEGKYPRSRTAADAEDGTTTDSEDGTTTDSEHGTATDVDDDNQNEADSTVCEVNRCVDGNIIQHQKSDSEDNKIHRSASDEENDQKFELDLKSNGSDLDTCSMDEVDVENNKQCSPSSHPEFFDERKKQKSSPEQSKSVSSTSSGEKARGPKTNTEAANLSDQDLNETAPVLRKKLKRKKKRSNFDVSRFVKRDKPDHEERVGFASAECQNLSQMKSLSGPSPSDSGIGGCSPLNVSKNADHKKSGRKRKTAPVFSSDSSDSDSTNKTRHVKRSKLQKRCHTFVSSENNDNVVSSVVVADTHTGSIPIITSKVLESANNIIEDPHSILDDYNSDSDETWEPDPVRFPV
ncbi:hypothetical protein FSP39_023585 [Pinctada imbricata]|uniref:Uncharacterized protein n=1 Tax=Pinctada imbricata TaxID=66713 RepID=A0AA88XUA7_PINIB|nr:hypothetical protein FSP39_023585 [Pinctada imbricata]